MAARVGAFGDRFHAIFRIHARVCKPGVMATEDPEPSTFPYHYEMEGSPRRVLTIHQDPTGAWRGGIGATVWDCALVLSKVCATCDDAVLSFSFNSDDSHSYLVYTLRLSFSFSNSNPAQQAAPIRIFGRARRSWSSERAADSAESH